MHTYIYLVLLHVRTYIYWACKPPRQFWSVHSLLCILIYIHHELHARTGQPSCMFSWRDRGLRSGEGTHRVPQLVLIHLAIFGCSELLLLIRQLSCMFSVSGVDRGLCVVEEGGWGSPSTTTGIIHLAKFWIIDNFLMFFERGGDHRVPLYNRIIMLSQVSLKQDW